MSIRTIGWLGLLLATELVGAEELSVADRLREDIEFLAADKLEGRDVGTPGGRRRPALFEIASEPWAWQAGPPTDLASRRSRSGSVHR